MCRNFFAQAQFDGLKKTLDAEMKLKKEGGAGLKKRIVDPITFEKEEKLCYNNNSKVTRPLTLMH